MSDEPDKYAELCMELDNCSDEDLRALRDYIEDLLEERGNDG